MTAQKILMENILISLFRSILLASLFTISVCSESRAEDLKGKWGVGLRLGPAVLMEENSDSTRGDPGLIIKGGLFYHLTGRIITGIDLEWERHAIIDNLSEVHYGDTSTISIVPKVEYHFNEESLISPYLMLGAGINLNSFSPSGDLQSLCGSCNIDPKNTLALEGGGGFDYRIRPNIAFNAEFDFKMNDGSANIAGSFGSFNSGNETSFQLCSLFLGFGIRYFY